MVGAIGHRLEAGEGKRGKGRQQQRNMREQLRRRRRHQDQERERFQSQPPQGGVTQATPGGRRHWGPVGPAGKNGAGRRIETARLNGHLKKST